MDVCVVGFLYFECEIPRISEPVEIGTERFVDVIRLGLGGALNTASVLARLGCEAGIVFPAGDGPADAAARWAIAQLGLVAAPFEARSNPAVTLVHSGPEERTFVSAADFDALCRCPPLPSTKWVHVPGLLEARALAPRLAEARRAGARISVSGSWAEDALDWLATLDGRPFDLLVMNDKEATRVAGSPERALELLTRVAVNVVVTRSRSGAIARMDDDTLEVPACVPRAQVDSTGAGDAFAAGLLCALLERRPPCAALRFATRVAARMLEVRGGVAFAADTFADDVFLEGRPTRGSPRGAKEQP